MILDGTALQAGEPALSVQLGLPPSSSARLLQLASMNRVLSAQVLCANTFEIGDLLGAATSFEQDKDDGTLSYPS